MARRPKAARGGEAEAEADAPVSVMLTGAVVHDGEEFDAVEVLVLSLSGAPAQITRVDPNGEGRFHVHSGADLLIHEIQPDAGISPIEPHDEPILKHFAWAHLPEPLRAVSRPFGMLAARMVATSARSAERSACLRKLLEAKDCAVRAAMEV